MDVFELSAKLRLDKEGYDSGLDEAESRTTKWGARLSKAAKVGAAALGAAATAVGAVTKKAVEGYAELEQLQGGVQTLFGDAAQTVIANANKAFKTAGMDANQYMETSIQSAAALINSLGGDQKKAAELMDLSITDMSDNVNKMGTTMQSVQDAYRGFSRGNFTMLDNLALGFAGTKEGMQQLLDKAQEISGVKYDISSYSDIVQAIHVVQSEMGITGTTAKEASETISGSLASFKSAWSNLVTGFADKNADLDALITNVVETGKTAFGNLLPVAEKALGGIADFVGKIAPLLAQELPKIVQALLPKLLNAATGLITALGQALPQLLTTLVTAIAQAAPMFAQAAVQMINSLAMGIGAAAPKLVSAIVSGVVAMAQALVQNAPLLIQGALTLIQGLAQGLITALPKLIETIPRLIEALVNGIARNLPKIMKMGVKLVITLASAIVRSIPRLVVAVVKLALAIPRNIVKAVPKMLSAGKKLISEFWTAAKNKLSALPEKALTLVKKIPKKVGEAVDAMIEAGANLLQGLWDGIKQKWEEFKAWWSEHVGGMGAETRKLLDESSPSKMFREIGYYVSEGFALGVEDGFRHVEDAMDGLGERAVGFSVSNDDIGDFGASYTSGAIEDTISIAIGGAVTSIVEDMANTLQDSMIRAMENVNITLDKRQFGKMTRKAVADAL